MKLGLVQVVARYAFACGVHWRRTSDDGQQRRVGRCQTSLPVILDMSGRVSRRNGALIMYLGATTSMMWVKCLDSVMGDSLRSRHRSSIFQWCSGAVVSGQWCSGAVVQWCSGAVVSGAVVQWCSGQWCSGAVVQWPSGANSRQGCRSGHVLQPSGRTEVATAIKPALSV